MVTPDELADALAIQYRCRKISDFAKHAFSAELLRIIPMETAVENSIFPLKLDNGKLGLAVADPTCEQLFEEISARHKVKIIPFVATRTEINRAIARHYLGRKMVEAQGKTILLVEDDALVRESVTNILTRKGYTVETAVDGMDAFNKIFTHNPEAGDHRQGDAETERL